MPTTRTTLGRLVISSAAALSLATIAGNAMAMSSEEMISTAKTACLESAAKDGWKTDLAKVISSKVIDADKVEVVFDLTKDGTNTARLTCPFSLSKGVVGALGEAVKTTTEAVPAVEAPVAEAPAAEPGAAVDRNRAWWLLLPLGLGLASWAALRGGREADTAEGFRGTYGTTTTTSTTYTGTTAGNGIFVEANAGDGLLEVREQPDALSTVLRRVRNGDSVGLTGHRRGDWLEVAQGGWVRDAEVRYDRANVRFS
ncbi:MAG: SH3 domain-containing protein [Cyanobacteriota bacterium]|jgi:hypothetical protein